MSIEFAIRFAKNAHADQLRKYTNEPYLCHPIAVAGLVASVCEDKDMFIAAILHDVVEDTHVEINTILEMFGSRISSMVEGLTDISKPEDGNRKIRKAIDRDHIANSSEEVKTIKLADLIDNSKTITVFDPDFAKVYMAEKKLLLEVLGEGNKTLFDIAYKLVVDYYVDLVGTR